MIGILFSVYSGCAFLSSLFIGKLFDRFGRRNVFLYAGFDAFAAFLGSSLANDFTTFVIWRGIAGIFTGTVGNAFAYVSNVVPDNSKSVYMSYLQALMSSCFVIGPLVGGGLAVFSIRAPFFAASGIAFSGLCLTFFFVRKPTELMAKKLDEEDPSLSIKSNFSTSQKLNNMESQSDNPMITGEGKTLDKPLLAIEDNAKVEAASDPSNKQLPQQHKNVSPWYNPGAVLIGGVCTLNTACYTGTAVLVPLLLLSSAFGIVNDDDSKDDDSSDAQKISLIPGYLLGMFGFVQAVSMVYIFPRVNKRFGLIYTGCAGAAIVEIAFAFLAAAKRVVDLVPIYLFLALGNSFCRPVFPAFLGSIAPKGRNAEYINISNTFGNLAMMSAGQLTLLFTYDKTFTILLTAFLFVLNAVIMLCYGCYQYFKNKNAAKLASTVPVIEQGKSPFELFFGEGMPEDVFWDDIVRSLNDVIAERGLKKAVTLDKGQKLVKELLLSALPLMPESFEERMKRVRELYHSLGHDEWAEELGHKYIDFGLFIRSLLSCNRFD